MSPVAFPLNSVTPLNTSAKTAEQQLSAAKELKQAYGDFVGKTFYGQMLKSMRSTVGDAAYFNGGQGEKVFRSQLDQQLADEMSAATAETFAEPMFRHQFPHEAALLDDASPGSQESSRGLGDLAGLRRR